MFPNELTIFGAGLIGGSIALAARRAGVSRIVAVDVREKNGPDGLFDDWLSADDHAGVEKVLKTTDLSVLCTPVRVIESVLAPILAHTSGVVTDCGSTKRALVQAAAGLHGRERYVPGHPMAGHPEGGIKNSRADLFDDRRWILCPTGAAPAAVEQLRGFITALGATPVELSAEEHDRSVAFTSHVPQVLASVLSAIVDQERALAAAGPGFASTTRVAGGAEAMWKDIFQTNSDEVARALLLLSERLQSLSHTLSQGDLQGVLEALETARALREPSNKS